jgi:hypothetical protein
VSEETGHDSDAYVRVSDRGAAVVPPLTAVRDQVVREWENERRQRARNDA